MTYTILQRPGTSALSISFPLVLAVASGLAGCGALDVSDPTAVEQHELENATGADLLRRAALKRLYYAVGQVAQESGIVADEFFTDTPALYAQIGIVNGFELLDRRDSKGAEEVFVRSYSGLQETRRAAKLAMPGLEIYAGPARVGEMFAVRGFAELSLAENVCPGFPLHEIKGYTAVYGGPLSTAEAFERALTDFDSAFVLAADSARILSLARVGRARALLGLGRFDEAGATAAAVPTEYVQTTEFTGSAGQYNPMGSFLINGAPRSIADVEGGKGLDFLSAEDPRVQGLVIGSAEDGTPLHGPAKYVDPSAPIVLASGLEARLIEAEAALHMGGDWLTILNDLRATQISPPLNPLVDPGTEEARVDLLFRERAFWLFATMRRLGDLRRLIAHYGRDAETVFPTGDYRLGGVYASGTSIPFPAAAETPFNPAVTGCTGR